MMRLRHSARAWIAGAVLLASACSDAPDLDRSQLRVLRADFEYARLEGWFETASPEALAVPGAVFVDLDEAANRLRVGVAHGA